MQLTGRLSVAWYTVAVAYDDSKSGNDRFKHLYVGSATVLVTKHIRVSYYCNDVCKQDGMHLGFDDFYCSTPVTPVSQRSMSFIPFLLQAASTLHLQPAHKHIGGRGIGLLV